MKKSTIALFFLIVLFIFLVIGGIWSFKLERTYLGSKLVNCYDDRGNIIQGEMCIEKVYSEAPIWLFLFMVVGSCVEIFILLIFLTYWLAGK